MSQAKLNRLVKSLLTCELCPQMHRPAVSGGAILSKVVLVGQAPGVKEPVLKRPFAWTAGKTLFRWFNEQVGMDEETFRRSIYIAAVCRCYPGKNPKGGDRVPDKTEIKNCNAWMEKEFEVLKPSLVIPVGKLAIQQFLKFDKLIEVIGKTFTANKAGHSFDIIPLPHPSGASTWHRMEPGKTLVNKALRLIKGHPDFG